MAAPRILDRRSAAHRWFETRWRSWQDHEPVWLPPAAAATTALQHRILEHRLKARPTPPVNPLVVSVGNLRVGGTGKTPVVIDTVVRLCERNVLGVVLVRGYGSGRRGPCLVDPEDRACGDEARLIARDGGWPVIQAADRREGFAFACSIAPRNGVILLEDAHQTAGVPRHRDILILDRWCGDRGSCRPRAGRLIPWGPYREGAEGADRADVWITESAAEDAPCQPELHPSRPVLSFRRSSVPPRSALDCAAPYGVVCGLARPEAFENSCEAVMGRPPGIIARFDDHAVYASADVAALMQAGSGSGVAHWLTTGKDHGKLGLLWPDALTLHEVGLALDWKSTSPADLIVGWLAERT